MRRIILVLPLAMMACVSQSGRPDMKMPDDPALASVRHEAMSILPTCASDEDCTSLLVKAREWGARQVGFALRQQRKNRLSVSMYATRGGFGLMDADSSEILIDIAQQEGGPNYLRFNYNCLGIYNTCENAEALRLSLYQYVDQRS